MEDVLHILQVSIHCHEFLPPALFCPKLYYLFPTESKFVLHLGVYLPCSVFCFYIEDNYLWGYGAVQASGLRVYLRERLWPSLLDLGVERQEEQPQPAALGTALAMVVAATVVHFELTKAFHAPQELELPWGCREALHVEAPCPRALPPRGVCLGIPESAALRCGILAEAATKEESSCPRQGGGFWFLAFSPILREDLQWTEQLQSPAV